MPQTEPMPPDIGKLNLGIILETPFLHQALMLPKVFNTIVESTALPGGVSQGTSTYTFSGSDLALNVCVNETSEKRTEYHYTPSDPSEEIAAIEAEIHKRKAELKTMSNKADVAICKVKIKILEQDIKKLKKMTKQGIVPSRLVRTSFQEKRIEADIEVAGETIFEYAGANIVKSTSISTTNEDPPQVKEMIRLYNYNDLGQLISMDLYGSLTEYTYDPMFRLVSAECNFISPMGDFVSKDKTVYTYTPPGSDPIPANALIISITNAQSGPAAELETISLDMLKPGAPDAGNPESAPATTEKMPLTAAAQTAVSEAVGVAAPAGEEAGGMISGMAGKFADVASKIVDGSLWGKKSAEAPKTAQDLSSSTEVAEDFWGTGSEIQEDPASVAAEVQPSEVVPSMDQIMIDFELPKVMKTTVNGTYVYAG